MSHAEAVRILFIDDEPGILRSLERTLKRDGFSMRFTSSSSEALDILQRDPVDVVVSDLRMPGPDGHQVLDFLRRERPDVVRILMSAHVVSERALDDEAVQRFVEKPWDPQQLRRLLREAADAVAERHRHVDAVKSGAADQFHRPLWP